MYGRKEDVVDFLMKDINIQKMDKIIAAGDSPCDINMLFKIHDIGGIIYYINSYYNHAMEDKSTSSLINSISCNNLDCSIYGTDEWQLAYTSIYNKWLNQYNSGSVSREKIEQIYSLLEIQAMHNLSYGNNKKNFPVDLSEYERKFVLVKSSDEVLHKFNE